MYNFILSEKLLLLQALMSTVALWLGHLILKRVSISHGARVVVCCCFFFVLFHRFFHIDHGVISVYSRNRQTHFTVPGSYVWVVTVFAPHSILTIVFVLVGIDWIAVCSVIVKRMKTSMIPAFKEHMYLELCATCLHSVILIIM